MTDLSTAPRRAPLPELSPAPPPEEHNVFLKMLPIALAVFVGFLTIGLPLPVLPLHLHYALGLSPVAVGVVIGAQFVTALLSRAWAGGLADTRGAKPAMIAGCAIATASGLAYLASLAFTATPAVSVGVLLIGRICLGCAESLVITGALSWGVILVGPRNAGKVMAWVGAAMYAAYASGAPLGTLIDSAYGFAGISAATIVIPLLALAIVARASGVPAIAARRMPFYKVLGAVWVPGLGLMLCSVGLGVMTTFVALLFAAKGWGSASLAFTIFGLAFIGIRLLFAHLPDKIGGGKVALVCVLIEAVGQLLIWQADHVLIAYLGAALTGLGFSLAFPGFGVEAVRRAPPQSRGAAMGAFVAFLDLSLGITGPSAGAIASADGVSAVYLAGAVAVASSAIIAVVLIMSPPRPAA